MKLWLAGREIGEVLRPGEPEWVGGDGATLGWVVRDQLFLARDGEARLCALPDEAEGVWPDPTGWWVALGQGFVRVDPRTAVIEAMVLDDESRAIETRVGRDVGVFLEAPGSRVVRFSDGETLDLPEGAVRSRWLTPFGTGEGAVWVDGGVVYRSGGRIEALGRVSGVRQVTVGPLGALLVEGTTTVLAGPKGFGVTVPEGAGALWTTGGVVRLEGDGVVERGWDGRVLRRWEGEGEPVAWLGEQVCTWEDDGRIGPIVGFCEGAVPVGEGVRARFSESPSLVRVGKESWPVFATAAVRVAERIVVSAPEGAVYAFGPGTGIA